MLTDTKEKEKYMPTEPNDPANGPRHKNEGQDPPGTMPDALLLTVDEAAAMLNVGRTHLYKLHSSGRVPLPVHLGKSIRWNRPELEGWVRAGCPTRDKWEQIKKRTA